MQKINLVSSQLPAFGRRKAYAPAGICLKLLLCLRLIANCYGTNAQVPTIFSDSKAGLVEKDVLSRAYLVPTRIVWQTPDSSVLNADHLLTSTEHQPYFGDQRVTRLVNKGGTRAGIILDFGREIHGGIQITTSTSNRVTRKLRIRFGESVSECMSDVIGDGTTGTEGGATNHHAMRDFEMTVPGYGTAEAGNSGFRFARIDIAEPGSSLAIKEIRAVATYRDIPYLGSFKCNDERLNRIWKTGAYTVHLNMQDYLWDGIKRDRMVWIGDMHPEVMTINSVFGYQELVPKSLDFVRNHTPVEKWMNGISAYSMWWIILQHDWYLYHGKRDYLQQQAGYLVALLDTLRIRVDASGKENLNPGFRFIDWPSSENEKGIHAGLQSLMVLAFDRGATLCEILGQPARAKEYRALVTKMKTYVPDPNKSKQAASLLALAGIVPAEKANREVIAVGGTKNYSTFFGYYMLQAQAKAGDYQTCLDNIRSYWGGMLDLGATTFWEDFDLEEAKNAGRIDEVVPAGKLDYHRITGAYCYIGLRRSLCHGWASGPTAWLTEHVLGFKVVEPGCKTISIEPHLGDLEWADGSFPTPHGVIKVRHTKGANGKVNTTILAAPPGVRINGVKT
ncbi:alpha-L-rhamnosidase [Segetibacter sp. 3557_3]|uniref:alpha-L-rhamnosidase-related protein n=1 Tax=Segetibacter sp. 3557_3 TaxID=2547429 RepID=UPI0010584296|nr:alpha-L-rhamnosidase C-terminal domain-containing protein [Segetibacter sp. 3557_3]TDH24212.1 alpha-L-rhamnosidase [Segetibacter sp. 3557_3]